LDFRADKDSPAIPIQADLVNTPFTPPPEVDEGGVTVTVALAVFAPSVVLTVMVAVPAATPVTRPLAASTRAMAVLLELHVTAWLVALEGLMVFESVLVAFTPSVSDAGDMATPVTATVVGPVEDAVVDM
jgi:hypothetical protein